MMKHVILEVDSPKFYSMDDEACFFDWINKISSVKNIEGRKKFLYIAIDDSKLTSVELQELIAVFYRYSLDLKKLKIFDKPEFHLWFSDRNAYWHNSVFGSE